MTKYEQDQIFCKIPRAKQTSQVKVLSLSMLSIAQSFWHGSQAEVLRGAVVTLLKIKKFQKYYRLFCSTLYQFRSQYLQERGLKLHRRDVLFYFQCLLI